MSGTVLKYLAVAMTFATLLPLPALADPPRSQADLRAFILDVAQRSRSTESATEKLEARYDFIHTKVTEERNPKGELKKREVERVHHRPGADANHPGGPTGPHARSSASPGSAKDDKEVSREDFQVDAELLGRFSFTPAGEETVRGRLQRVIDFEPAGDSLPVHNFKDKYINQTAGRLWIDEEARILTRLQMRLRKPVNVWGGLLGAVWEFHFDLQREQTPDGHWYTREVQWHLKGRRVFVTKIIDFHETRSDLRRID
ncbi:MAG: hypothetical protein KJ072_17515 [Verrucomicrobia bacterium]|nr:hypothetical protein [Verrucomicrobiota bacterium]